MTFNQFSTTYGSIIFSGTLTLFLFLYLYIIVTVFKRNSKPNREDHYVLKVKALRVKLQGWHPVEQKFSRKTMWN